jgi:hypothetical protein
MEVEGVLLREVEGKKKGGGRSGVKKSNRGVHVIKVQAIDMWK